MLEILEKKSLLATVVAILDSGIDLNHEILKENVWTNSQEIENNKIDDDNNGFIDDIHGWNFVDNNNDVSDRYGHGTHVAGIIDGMNSSVKLMSIKIIGNNGVGSTDALIRGIDYINKMSIRENIVAANNSWTLGVYGSSVVEGRINQLYNNNVIFVCAAGNNHSNLDVVSNYPSSFKSMNIVSVASITRDGMLAYSSNYGIGTVDVATYGTNIYSTWINNSYNTMSGTSMAAPFITGKISLLSGSVNEKIFSIYNAVTKTENLSTKVITGGFLNVNVDFIQKKPINMVPINVIPQVSASIKKVGIYSVSGNITKNQPLKVYINNSFIGFAKISYNKHSKSYVFNMNLNRKHFNRGWNVVYILDPVLNNKLDSKLVKRIF